MNKISFSWFCPSYVPGTNGQEDIGISEVLDSAVLAEENGMDSILTPTDSNCLDPWIVSSYILQYTKKIKPIIAIRTGYIQPVYTSRMISTLNYFSRGRIKLNIVSGGSPVELAKEGNFLNHTERYERTYEFMEILTNLMSSGGPYSFKGAYYQVKNATLYPKLEMEDYPIIYIAGASEKAKEIANNFNGTYLFWAEPLDKVREHLDYFKLKNQKDFGLRINIIVRENREEALEVASNNGLLERNNSSKRLMELIGHHSDSEGQRRLSQLAANQDKYDTCFYSTSIAGKTGSVPTLIGSGEDIRNSLDKYKELGISDFIFSSVNKEEIYHVGQEVVKYYK
jgi:alkanesulfonate monooxygenase